MSKDEKLEFSNPTPCLYTGILDISGRKDKTLRFRVREKDVFIDDTYLDHEIKIPFENYDQQHEISSKVTLELIILFVFLYLFWLFSFICFSLFISLFLYFFISLFFLTFSWEVQVQHTWPVDFEADTT